jgi:hypothetical protein
MKEGSFRSGTVTSSARRRREGRASRERYPDLLPSGPPVSPARRIVAPLPAVLRLPSRGLERHLSDVRAEPSERSRAPIERDRPDTRRHAASRGRG